MTESHTCEASPKDGHLISERIFVHSTELLFPVLDKLIFNFKSEQKGIFFQIFKLIFIFNQFIKICQ